MNVEILERMERAVLKVRERLFRATGALARAGIPYAVVGGHAVASWVATKDEGAVRNTRDVDLLVRREDYPRVKEALESVGFKYYSFKKHHKFVDDYESKLSKDINVFFESEPYSDNPNAILPRINIAEHEKSFQCSKFEELVLMSRICNRLNDRVNIEDLVDVGLLPVDALNDPEMAVLT